MTDVEVPVLPGKIHFSIFQFLYLFRVAFSERSEGKRSVTSILNGYVAFGY